VLPEPTTAVTLADGRLLAADDVGDPAGVPIVYLHGAPDCRLARHPDDALASAAGVRLVAVDRPGYGWTDPQPGRPDVLAWGREVGVLLEQLGIDRCRILAWSAGAPWAFGIAGALGDRVERLVTYAALAPLEAFDDAAVAAASGARAGIAAEVLEGADVDELAEGVAAMLVPPPPLDLDTAREIVAESHDERARAEIARVPGALDALVRSLAAAVDRQGGAGLHADVVVQFSPGMAGVVAAVPGSIALVHGRRDPIAGPEVGRWLARQAARAECVVWPEAGHHGLFPGWTQLLALATA
jgi:pimeloyl-ACP methyl ester carboxylesterase